MAPGNQDGSGQANGNGTGADKNGADQTDPAFNAATARLLRREALRRAAEEVNTTSGPGLEGMLGRISAEVTADAAETLARTKKP